jgi:hypothetical protein
MEGIVRFWFCCLLLAVWLLGMVPPGCAFEGGISADPGHLQEEIKGWYGIHDVQIAGCQLIEPATENISGWSGWRSIDSGHLVWRWIDHRIEPAESVLMVRNLRTGAQTELLRVEFPERIDNPAIFENSVYFERETESADSSSREIFRIDIGGGPVHRVTFNRVPDAQAMAGRDYLVTFFADRQGGSYRSGIKYIRLTDGSEHDILTNRRGTPMQVFDGKRWVVFLDDHQLYKLDLEAPKKGAKRMSDQRMGLMWMSFNPTSGELVTGTNIPGETASFSLDIWDMETDVREVIVDDPHSQGAPDAFGSVISYLDSQAAGQGWFENNLSELKIIDRETGVIRVITPTLGRHYDHGIWEKWLAFNTTGPWGDLLVLCNLEEGGFIDAAGHVIPMRR